MESEARIPADDSAELYLSLAEEAEATGLGIQALSMLATQSLLETVDSPPTRQMSKPPPAAIRPPLSKPAEELTDTDRMRLVKRMRERDDDQFTKERLCRSFLPLIQKLARMRPNVIPLDERIQSGMLIVPDWALRYDPSNEKGKSLSSYVGTRAYGAMIDEERRQFHFVSRNAYEKLKEIAKIEDPRKRQQALHELTQFKDSKEGENGKGRDIYAAQLMEDDGYINLSMPSLDYEFVNADYDTTIGLGALLAAPTNVHQEVVNNLEKEEVRRLVKYLPKEERFVIESYYEQTDGLYDQDNITIEKISEKMGLSQGRVSQIHISGLKNLAKLMAGKRLRPRPGSLQTLQARTPHEKRRQYLDRVYNKLNQDGLEDLTPYEVTAAIDALAPNWNWQSSEVQLRGKKYMVLQHAEAQAGTELNLDRYQTATRKVGWKESTLTMLIDSPSAPDLMLAIDLEKQIEGSRQFPVNESLMSKFSAQQLEILKNMYSGNSTIAFELGLDESTVRTHVLNMLKNLGLKGKTDKHLAVIAAYGGLVSLDNVPDHRTDSLTTAEQETLRDDYCLTQAQNAAKLGIPYGTSVSRWHTIYTKLGVSSRRQATLMAVKDGLIPPPQDVL